MDVYDCKIKYAKRSIDEWWFVFFNFIVKIREMKGVE